MRRAGIGGVAHEAAPVGARGAACAVSRYATAETPPAIRAFDTHRLPTRIAELAEIGWWRFQPSVILPVIPGFRLKEFR